MPKILLAALAVRVYMLVIYFYEKAKLGNKATLTIYRDGMHKPCSAYAPHAFMGFYSFGEKRIISPTKNNRVSY